MHYKLTEEIIALSDSKFWDSAKLEWSFQYAYVSDETQTCLCGHNPIRNICVINNKINFKATEVGNCCVNKFLGIDEGNKIFTSIKRLKEDSSKSMSLDVLIYLNEKKVLSEFEYKFYLDIINKRKLSFKQRTVKERINQKLINFTSYELNSHFVRLNLVLKWAEDNKWFDINFILSLKKSCEKKGKLSQKQQEALENIITKLGIEKV